MFKRISDNGLIEGIRNQDDAILNWLYDNYFSTVRKYVLNNSGTSDDVSDLFQDTIIVLYKQITENSLHLTTDLKGYFFGVARNIWSAQLRKKPKITELDMDFPEESSQDEMTQILLERIVSRAFDKLKPDMQQVLTLFSEGYSFDEIAIRLDLTNESHARRKKYVCKEALMELVKKDPEYQEYLRYLK